MKILPTRWMWLGSTEIFWCREYDRLTEKGV